MQSSTGHYEHTKRRPLSPDPQIAALTRLIFDAERHLARLKRERKSLINRATMAELRARPDHAAKQSEGMKRAWQDPEKRKAWAGNGKGKKTDLPPMTRTQRLRYNQLRNQKKWTREDALHEVLHSARRAPSLPAGSPALNSEAAE